MDILKQAGDLLLSLAPTVATAFGGPFAGVATQKLIGALGLAPDSTKEQVLTAIAGATPEQLLKIKEVENAFILDMKKLDVDIMKLEAGDMDSARKREIATNDWTPRIIAGLILGLYVYIQYYILGHIIDTGMREIVMRSLGTLDASVGLILGYYFGSSIGSHSKNAQISTLVDKTTGK